MTSRHILRPLHIGWKLNLYIPIDKHVISRLDINHHRSSAINNSRIKANAAILKYSRSEGDGRSTARNILSDDYKKRISCDCRIGICDILYYDRDIGYGQTGRDSI